MYLQAKKNSTSRVTASWGAVKSHFPLQYLAFSWITHRILVIFWIVRVPKIPFQTMIIVSYSLIEFYKQGGQFSRQLANNCIFITERSISSDMISTPIWDIFTGADKIKFIISLITEMYRLGPGSKDGQRYPSDKSLPIG